MKRIATFAAAPVVLALAALIGLNAWAQVGKEAPNLDEKKPKVGDSDSLNRASERLSRIERRGDQMDKQLGIIQEMIQKLPAGPEDKQTRDGFRRFLLDYKRQAKDIGELETDVRMVAPILKKELSGAPADYELVAADMEQRAKKEPFAEHQAHFVQMAKDARAHGATLRQQAQQVDDKVEKIIAGIARIQANARVASAMLTILDVTPDPQRLQFLDRFLSVVEQNNKQMNDAIREWRQYWDRQRWAPTQPEAQGVVPPPLPLPVVPAEKAN